MTTTYTVRLADGTSATRKSDHRYLFATVAITAWDKSVVSFHESRKAADRTASSMLRNAWGAPCKSADVVAFDEQNEATVDAWIPEDPEAWKRADDALIAARR